MKNTTLLTQLTSTSPPKRLHEMLSGYSMKAALSSQYQTPVCFASTSRRFLVQHPTYPEGTKYCDECRRAPSDKLSKVYPPLASPPQLLPLGKTVLHGVQPDHRPRSLARPDVVLAPSPPGAQEVHGLWGHVLQLLPTDLACLLISMILTWVQAPIPWRQRRDCCRIRRQSSDSWQF